MESGMALKHKKKKKKGGDGKRKMGLGVGRTIIGVPFHSGKDQRRPWG